MVASSSDWRSAVSGKPAEKRINVLRPGTTRRVFARLRMARRSDRAPKSDSFRDICPIAIIKEVGGPADAISTVGPEAFGETAEYFTSVVARLNFSASAVKFWTTW